MSKPSNGLNTIEEIIVLTTDMMSNTSHHSSAAPSHHASSTSPASRQQSTKAERTADAAKAFDRSLKVAAKEIDADVRLRAESLHENWPALKKQDKNLQEHTKQLSRENDETEKWIDKSKKRLTEFDDLDDIGEGLEDELANIEAMLDIMETKQKARECDPKGNSS